ncbi:hypothetical protein ARMGADRAFT_575614 [Armillaria gallica]|uniref:Uncharacterized protein n=1 Tax=Armillaria gallica TaxID=47427 RepID=A0A2H3DT58_ARMGA|nr:hypothetical protein ARMGADRAFT_575614 [Armillaria gallica]
MRAGFLFVDSVSLTVTTTTMARSLSMMASSILYPVVCALAVSRIDMAPEGTEGTQRTHRGMASMVFTAEPIGMTYCLDSAELGLGRGWYLVKKSFSSTGHDNGRSLRLP